MNKKKSDYAIVCSCNPGYGFGMISSMNAQNYFGTDADWEIACTTPEAGDEVGFTKEYRDKVSNAFPFNVSWTPIQELMKTVVDRRTGGGILERFWLAYWLLAYKLLKEKKYKAVCVIQADTFIFTNLDLYFQLADSGYLVCSEHPAGKIRVEDMPYGDDKAIYDRSMCGIFDSVNFIGQKYAQLPGDIVEYQCEDAFKRESNHSVITLNRAVCKYGSKKTVIGLDGNLWAGDSIWGDGVLVRVLDDRIYNHAKIQIRAWHCRWWQKGRVFGEWANNKQRILDNKDNAEFLKIFDIHDANYTVVRDFMVKFNDMTPEIKSEEYAKGSLIRPKWELGEDD